MRSWPAIALTLACSGCFTARYLTQAATGQAALIARARPLSSVVKDPRTEPRVQRLLELVPEVKAYGESQGLKPTENYVRYSDLARPAAVWVVQACPELDLQPKRWSFPIAGTVPYLGFFDERDARAYAKSLAEQEHLDVDVRGASAYSTLGWFKDPVLSTMLSDGPDAVGSLANVVLHESVHATVYVPGQSSFDESLASFVADALTGRWLQRRFGESSPETTAYAKAQARGDAYVAGMHRAYEELDAVYRSELPADAKRARKTELLAALKAELGTKRELNNATLAGYRTYDTGGPAFDRLLGRCDGDVKRFLKVIGTLEASSFAEPQQEDFAPVIDSLTRCP